MLNFMTPTGRWLILIGVTWLGNVLLGTKQNGYVCQSPPRYCNSTGALSYSINGIEYRDKNDRNPMVTVSKDGPYLIAGGVELIDFGDGASKEHYTLCRCGASQN